VAARWSRLRHCVTARRGRTVKRELIMGYVAFAVIVAAGGALILWFGWRYCRTTDTRSLGRAGYAANGLPLEPIPPFKRTIGGASVKDLERWAFEQRVEAWQKRFQSRGGHNNSNPHVLKGNQYHNVPQAREGNEVSTSA
jgi:hypothetical protein